MGAGFFLSLHIFYLAAALVTHRHFSQFPFAPFDPVEALMGGAVYSFSFGLPVALLIQLTDGVRHFWDKSKRQQNS